MRIGRRAFLRMTALATGAGLLGGSRPAAAEESAIGIHRATRNTLLGALGAGLRRLQTPLAPHKTYAGAQRVALGERPAARDQPSFTEACARRASAEAASGTRVLTRESLARLLHLANGDTGRDDGDAYRLRAAPSAGALYANELYVVALAVGGLERGVYYYDVGEHALVAVNAAAEPEAVAAALVAPDDAGGAAALVCITGVFARYQQRYSNRGYRYALIDTGHIGENLALAAAAAGVAHRALPRFVDDAVGALVRVDGADEAVCAVHAVGGVLPARRGPGRTAASPLVEKAAAGARVRGEEPTVRYHEATKLVVARGSTARHAHRHRPQRSASGTSPAPLAAGETVHLPTSERIAGAPLDRCIVERRSPAGFARRSITAEQLAFVLAGARPRGLTSTFSSQGIVEVVLAAHRVDGIDPGLYAYDGDARRLVAVRKEDLTETLPRACLGQSKAGDAAVGVLMIGRLREAAERYGERSYRDLLIEAGEIGERVYLAAEAVRLRARNLAAFLDDDLDDLVGLDGRERAVVHLTMVGHPA